MLNCFDHGRCNFFPRSSQVGIFRPPPLMQAALRAGLQEIARGISTGVVVWAGVGTPACYCICEAPPKAPDCLCGGAQTSFIDFIKEGAVLSIVLFFWACSLVFSCWLGRCSASWRFRVDEPTSVVSAGVPLDAEELQALAKRQTAKARARAVANGGSG